MRYAHSERVLLVGVIVAVVGLLAAGIALGSERARDESIAGAHLHAGHYAHAGLRFPAALQPSTTPSQTGFTHAGGDIISYLEGGRDAKRVPGTGGRMIYTGTDAFEPTLGIDKEGNIFYQGARADQLFFPTLVVSRDGGRSWDDVTPQTHPHTQDPLVYVDPATGRAFTADLTYPCITVSHTDDVGQSWTTSQACGLFDHQNISAGPSVSSSTNGYPNILYLCATDGGNGTPLSTVTSCLKSLDGGITWVRTGTPAYTDDPRAGEGHLSIPGHCGGASGHSFVDTKGVLYLPRGWCGQPYLAISKDEGATWERIQVADNGMSRGGTTNVCAGVCHNASNYAHEAAVGVDAKGNIYYFWMGRNRLPYLALSRDGGKSFSNPMMVGPPGLEEAWGPTMEIGATGKIALAYVGSTNAPGGESPDGVGEEYADAVTWDGYITTSVDALSETPRFFTASINPSSDPIMRGECDVNRCGVQVDFIDVVIGPDGRPYTSMVDGCPPPGDACAEVIGEGIVGTLIGGPRLR